ncbi:hypothetical protein JST97_07400 [bacterium]|nr:hypothetical protein [bacterium]
MSIAFPPKFDSEGLQVSKYLKYLIGECGPELPIDVVTSRVPTLNMPFDASLAPSAQGLRQRVELPIFENKYTNFLLRKLWPSLAYSPDSKFTFHHQWWRAARQLRSTPGLIYSRSFPASSALMALKLKRHFKVPWLFHLSDPWADSPHIEYGSQRARQYNQQLERMCFEAADVICLTSHRTIQYYQKKYADLNKRFEFYPNVYDPEDVVAPTSFSNQGRTKLRLVHTGGLAGSRSPEPFLRALSMLETKYKERLEVIFAGHVDRQNRAILSKYAESGVNYLGPLDTYQEAIRLQQSADVLLLIDFPVDREDLRVYFLSKLLDYHLTGKPILAVTDAGSECANFIAGERSHSFTRPDSAGMARHLEWLVEEFSQGRPDYFQSRPVRLEYSAAHNARRLAELFREFL